jgi:hypothetical protein
LRLARSADDALVGRGKLTRTVQNAWERTDSQ